MQMKPIADIPLYVPPGTSTATGFAIFFQLMHYMTRRLTGCYLPRILVSLVMAILFWPAVYAQNPSIELVPADPESGFNFPYVLRTPKSAEGRGKVLLLVETNNSGNNDDFDQQIEAAMHFAGNKG